MGGSGVVESEVGRLDAGNPDHGVGLAHAEDPVNVVDLGHEEDLVDAEHVVLVDVEDLDHAADEDPVDVVDLENEVVLAADGEDPVDEEGLVDVGDPVDAVGLVVAAVLADAANGEEPAYAAAFVPVAQAQENENLVVPLVLVDHFDHASGVVGVVVAHVALVHCWDETATLSNAAGCQVLNAVELYVGAFQDAAACAEVDHHVDACLAVEDAAYLAYLDEAAHGAAMVDVPGAYWDYAVDAMLVQKYAAVPVAEEVVAEEGQENEPLAAVDVAAVVEAGTAVVQPTTELALVMAVVRPLASFLL